jgi:hypothetical protein
LTISVGEGDPETVVGAEHALSTLDVGDDNADPEIPPLDDTSSYAMVSEANTFASVLPSPSSNRPMPRRFV